LDQKKKPKTEQRHETEGEIIRHPPRGDPRGVFNAGEMKIIFSGFETGIGKETI